MCNNVICIKVIIRTEKIGESVMIINDVEFNDDGNIVDYLSEVLKDTPEERECKIPVVCLS